MSNLKSAAKALQSHLTVQNAPPTTIVHTPQQGYQAVPAPLGAVINAAKLNTENLALAIKTERIKRLYTQRELARRSGSSQGTITRVENGLCTSLWMVLKVVAALEMELKLE